MPMQVAGKLDLQDGEKNG